jgi:hypothetical protein
MTLDVVVAGGGPVGLTLASENTSFRVQLPTFARRHMIKLAA